MKFFLQIFFSLLLLNSFGQTQTEIKISKANLIKANSPEELGIQKTLDCKIKGFQISIKLKGQLKLYDCTSGGFSSDVRKAFLNISPGQVFYVQKISSNCKSLAKEYKIKVE